MRAETVQLMAKSLIASQSSKLNKNTPLVVKNEPLFNRMKHLVTEKRDCNVARVKNVSVV